jgi:hypothetical protein
MKDNEKFNDAIYKTLKNEITQANGQFISLRKLQAVVESISLEMPVVLQSPEGQVAFYDSMSKIISGEIVTPIGKKPNTFNGLYLKYRINKEKKYKDNELLTQIIRTIKIPASVDYYIKFPQNYLNDKPIIEIIMNYLNKQKIGMVTINERSYELFGDEKFFRGDDKNRSRGEIVLKRLGLDYSDIGCQETLEPFFSFSRQDFNRTNSRKICIVENKDTFWSMKRNILDNDSTISLDMIIYGEGKKIISSFKFIAEYGIDYESDSFLYFGDMDPEGVNIYYELKDKYNSYKIVPFHEGYEAILEIGFFRGFLKTPKQQKVKIDNIRRFADEFDNRFSNKIKELLEEGFYIPQEALSAEKIKERFGTT